MVFAMTQIKLVKKRRGEPTYVFLYTAQNVWRWYTPNRYSTFGIVTSEITSSIVVADVDRHEDIYVTIAKLCRARIRYEGAIAIVTNDEEMLEILKATLRKVRSKPDIARYRFASSTT